MESNGFNMGAVWGLLHLIAAGVILFSDLSDKELWLISLFFSWVFATTLSTTLDAIADRFRK
jgi:hypothetical protein